MVCLFLLGLAFSVVAHSRFPHTLDGLNLLDKPSSSAARTLSNNAKLLVDIKIHDNVILSDFHLDQLNRIVFGPSSSNIRTERLETVSGTDNRVFRTRLSLQRIDEIKSESSYRQYIYRIERVSNEKRILFPQFSMDSLRFSKLRVVMNSEYEEKLPLFLSKMNTKFNHEFATQLIESSVRRSSESINEILASSSILIEERGRMFSISLVDGDASLWNNNGKRSALMSHMSDFLMSNILDNEDVDYVEREFSQSLLLYGSNNVVQYNRKVNVSRFAWDNGVTGKGEIVNIVDSGLDYSHCFFSSPNEDYSTLNTKNRKVVLYERGTTGDFYDANGHGTHCSGISKLLFSLFVILP